MKQQINLTVNGQPYELFVEPHKLLLNVLRTELGLTGTKNGCDVGVCGACTVVIEGKLVSSCLKLAVEADGKDILTIEGLQRNGTLHPVQEAFVESWGLQCGFCTPGMVLTAMKLLEEIPRPSEQDIRDFLWGNLCRCTGYTKIFEAIRTAAERMQPEATTPSSQMLPQN